MLSITRFLAGLALMTVSLAVQAQQYTITDLGALAGQFPSSTGMGINAAGQVTGSSSGHIFVSDASTNALIDLGPGEGMGINASGQITGEFTSPSVPGQDAFITDPTTNAIIDLGTLVCTPGSLCGSFSAGTAINGSGQVTGFSFLASSTSGPRAIITDATTHAMTNLAADCGCQSEGHGINAIGQVTGWLRVPSTVQHAFITDAVSHAMIDIGTLGGQNSRGWAVNDSGHVTGDAEGPTGAHAFIYGKNFNLGVMLDLGTLGGDTSQGNAINASDQVVGTSLTSAAVAHAFLYSAGAMIDLNTTIGAAADSYTLISAQGINDRGQIVANGVEKNSGRNVAFLLTPIVSTTPTASITVTPATVAPGENATVTWFSTNVTSCTPSGGYVSGFTLFTGHIVVRFNEPGTYPLGISCTGPGGAATATTTLSVMAAPTLKLAANDIPEGSTVQISWTGFAGATSCFASGAWTGWLPASGSQSVGPLKANSYAFNLTCYAPGISLPAQEQDLVVYTPASQGPDSIEGVFLGDANVNALAMPGTVPAAGGLDGHGYAFNSTMLPYPLTALGQTFDINTLSLPTGAAKQTIGLSTDHLDSLTLLATAVNGNQPNQTFVVTYMDGSNTTYVQSVSDWHHPQSYSGETVAVAMGSRITPAGTVETGTFDLYAYRIPLDVSKNPRSLTLPANRNVIVLAANEVIGLRHVQVPISSAFNVYGIASTGQTPKRGGLDGHAYGLEADLIASGTTAPGQQFFIGAPDQPDAVSNARIPIGYLSGATSLTILAAAVNGNQPDVAFTVTYVDGTTTVFRQSMSDWRTPQAYPGESSALTMGSRITPTGTRQAGPWNLYTYTFLTDPGKSMSVLTLPATRNVVVLGVNALAR